MAQTVGNDSGHRPTTRQRAKVTRSGRGSQDITFEDTRDNAPRVKGSRNIVMGHFGKKSSSKRSGKGK